jgi:hypothetical protein
MDILFDLPILLADILLEADWFDLHEEEVVMR